MTIALNTAAETHAFALAGYCLCAKCDAIRRAAPRESDSWTLEPLSDAPVVDGSHVTLDARNVDHWSRNRGR